MDFIKNLVMVREYLDLYELKFVNKYRVQDHFSESTEKWFIDQDPTGNIIVVEDFGSHTCRVVGAVLSNGKEVTFENSNPIFLTMVLKYYYEKLIMQKIKKTKPVRVIPTDEMINESPISATVVAGFLNNLLVEVGKGSNLIIRRDLDGNIEINKNSGHSHGYDKIMTLLPPK